MHHRHLPVDQHSPSGPILQLPLPPVVLELVHVGLGLEGSHYDLQLPFAGVVWRQSKEARILQRLTNGEMGQQVIVLEHVANDLSCLTHSGASPQGTQDGDQTCCLPLPAQVRCRCRGRDL